MTDQPEPRDPAELLKKHFSTMTLPDEKPQYVMSARNRRKMEKIRQRVRELRGQRD